jgi:hypothetical protein
LATGADELQVPPQRSLGVELLATIPDGFRHPTDGYVGLHVMYRRL